MQPHKQNLFLAILTCAMGYFFIAAMGACSKLVSHQTSVFTILLFQNGICLLFTLPLIIKWGWKGLKTERIGLHLTRDLAGVGAFFCLFLSLQSIPLVDGILLLNTAPLWIPLIALIGFGIRMKGHVWWGMILGFIGVLFILKPGAESLSLASLIALVSGIGAGITFISVGRLASTEPTYRILFYYFLVGVLLMAPLAAWDFTIPSHADLLNLMGVGTFGFIGQVFTTYAFKHGKTTILAPITYSVVIFSGLFDWLFWDHLPDLFTYLGVILVVAGSIAAIYFEKRYQKKFPSTPS